MNVLRLGGLPLLTILAAAPLAAQAQKYPPLKEYLMESGAETALARSAAPERISSHATIKVLTASGYQIASRGDNGFTCLVLRGWGAPSFNPEPARSLVYNSALRAPICYDPVATRTVLAYQELRTRLALEGKDPDAIAQAVSAAYARGALPRMESVAFGYMFSPHQNLGPAGAWHPHMMIYAPYYSNASLGGNTPGGMLPFVNDDEGTPFTVIVMAATID